MKVLLLEVSLMNFIRWISKKIKRKVKVLLLDVSLMSFIFRISKDNQMEGESWATRSTIDELFSSDNQGDQMEIESGVT